MPEHAQRLWLCVLCLINAAVVGGCAGSRWAREHPDYADKYPRHTDSVRRIAKQAVDARHVAGDTGWYVGAAGRDQPVAAGGSFGMFYYPDFYRGMVEARGGLSALIAEGDHPLSGGVEGGLRVQPPSRIAPFAGVGVYAGWLPDWLNAEDGVDNNGNGFIDESGEENSYFVGAAYPEVGVHFWATSHLRLTASASYYLTTMSDNSDFVLYGVSLSFLERDCIEEYVPLVDCSDPVDPPKPAAKRLSESWPSEPWPAAAGLDDDVGRENKQASPYDSLPLPE